MIKKEIKAIKGEIVIIIMVVGGVVLIVEGVAEVALIPVSYNHSLVLIVMINNGLIK